MLYQCDTIIKTLSVVKPVFNKDVFIILYAAMQLSILYMKLIFILDNHELFNIKRRLVIP